MSDQTPARLHVVLAREAPLAVILRRGPSVWVRAIVWHTDTDQFEPGQWLRGRIYGERCDLSPDGSLFLYFATQWHKQEEGYRGAWTAISRPPYLTALALWPEGGTYGGGGTFIDRWTLWLNSCRAASPHPDHLPPKRLRVVCSDDQLTNRDRRALERIKAQGWQEFYRPAQLPNLWGMHLDDPLVWHRARPSADRFYLARHYYGWIPDHYTGPDIVDYALGDRIENKEIRLEGANWADWDQRGRVIYARDGQVFAQEPEQVGTFARPLVDLNDQTFEDIPAPGWARRW